MCSSSRSSQYQPKGEWIRKEKRLAIYMRDKFTCLYCTKSLHNTAPHEITLEHYIPRSEQGSNHECNLFTACKSCNCSRQDKPITVFANATVRQRIMDHILRPLNKSLAKALIQGTVDPTTIDWS